MDVQKWTASALLRRSSSTEHVPRAVQRTCCCVYIHHLPVHDQ